MTDSPGDPPPHGEPNRLFAESTWPEIAALDPARVVAILPIGAVEAHGPHLPLTTDGIIATAMAKAGARRLADRGYQPLVLPGLDYTAAPFADAFAGTVSVRPETVTALIVDIAAGLAARRFACLALANAHLDPANLGSLYAARRAIREGGEIAVAFPDITRKPWALRLGAEFASGACHAGRYEGSMVMAARPRAVREELRSELTPNPSSLSRAIREGLATFHEAGGPQAYFGDPAAATAEEGRERIEELGAILAEAVVAEVEPTPATA